MATYYINPTGTNTSPYDTAAKGATSLKQLVQDDGITLTNTDTTYIVGDNGNISEGNAGAIVAGTITKDPASTNKPVVTAAVANTMMHIQSTNCTIKDIYFQTSFTAATTHMITISTNGQDASDLTIDSCTFEATGSNQVSAIDNDKASDNFTLKNCVFINVEAHSSSAYENVVTVESTYSPSNTVIINNSFYNCATFDSTAVNIKMAGIVGSTIQNNIISGGGVGRDCNTSAGGTHNIDYNICHNTTTPFQTLAQQSNEITSDPLYTAPGSGDLTLQSGSPAKDGGTTTTATVDYNGVSRPQGASFDMGAFEFEEIELTCWYYTAKYKGSNRVYRDNGPGDFPKNLTVPANVDTSTGVMIDEGVKIDPSRYTVN